MGLHHVYFDDEAWVEAAKVRLLALRAADDAAKQMLITQYQAPRGQGKNIAARVLFDEHPDPRMIDTLARSVALGDRLEKDYQKSFEKTLYSEHLRRKKHLSFANDYMESAGFPGFDADGLFVKMGVGNGRVILSNPIIAPFHAPDHICYKHDKPNPDLKLLSFGRPNKIENFHSRLALFSVSTQTNDGKSQICALPLILIDPEVMNAIQSLGQSGDDSVKIAANRLLAGVQSLVPFGMHDYVHQMVLAHTDPQTVNLRRSGDSAPLADFREKERRSMFRDNHLFTPMAENNINMMTNVYELHAELLNRDVWREAFRKMPHIKTSAVRIATQFLCDLETVHGALVVDKGEDFAHRVSGLLSSLAISRLFRVIDVSDAILNQPMKLRDNSAVSFIGACDKLTLNSLDITQGDAARWLESVRIDKIIQPGAAINTPVLLQLFADNAERFPHLHRILEMGRSQENALDALHLTGFENVVARAFGGSGPMLNTPALMYNFPEGDGPILHTARLLHENHRVMSEGSLPAEFTEAMTNYAAAVTSGLNEKTTQILT